MASSKDVFAAIATHWSNSATLSAINGPYRDMKRYNAAFTHCIFSSVLNRRMARSCANEYWLHTFRFTVRAQKETEVESAIELIGAAFDPATLSISNGGQVKLERVSEAYFPEDENVSVGVLEYDCVRWKARIDV